MTPEDIGFEPTGDGNFSHQFGKGLEILLERYGATEWLIAFYQNQRLLTPKHRAWIHPGGMLLVAGLPLMVERMKEDAEVEIKDFRRRQEQE